MSSTTIAQAIREIDEAFSRGGIAESRLEAEIILSHILGIDRSELALRLEDNLTRKQSEKAGQLVERRLDREPVAYLIGNKEFFGLDFHVTRDTLIPRPETELLVEKTLEMVRSLPTSNCTVADIGTGCGVIAVSLAVNLPDVEIYATDISVEALEVAESNAEQHCVAERVHCLRGDLLGPLQGEVNIMAANLPYVTDLEMQGLADDVRLYEPEIALRGGFDGLNQIRRLLEQAGNKLKSGGAILLEIGANQGLAVRELAQKYFPESGIEIISDLNGHDRIVVVWMGPNP